jgi:hypothetical protein
MITISGTIGGFQFNNGGDKAKITDISVIGELLTLQQIDLSIIVPILM